MKAMVLAAGVGSRLEPLTTLVPKPLVPIANVPVMEHILQLLKEHGIVDVVSNLHHLPDALIEYFGAGNRLDMNLSFRVEKTLSGDAGGVRACKDFFGGETFLVLMGDLLTDADLTGIVAEHKRKGALATIAIKRVEDVSQFGVVLTDSEGFITGFQEKPHPSAALSDLASTGIYVLEPEIFDHIPREGSYGFGRQLFPSLVEKGAPVLGVEFHNYWSDVGTIKQYRTANFDAVDGTIRLSLPGVPTEFGLIGDGSTIASGLSHDGVLMVGRNTRVGKNVSAKGRVIVGDDCVIEDGVELEDSIIWSNSRIESGAKIVDLVYGAHCIVSTGSKHCDTAQSAATVK